ncbi:MAG: Smr/MutS family protein [bacterium]|nr:Smr/MutS family protein [bacterium]
MAKKKQRKPTAGGPAQGPRRGLRRSIRHQAFEDWDDAAEGSFIDRQPPRIMLRMLPLREALALLAREVRLHRDAGETEVVVVHGKGSNSPGGVPVLKPEVHRWCDDHPDLVAGRREAPRRWGGAGALVLTLNDGN